MDASIASNIAFGIEDANIDEQRLKQVAEWAELSPLIESELPSGFRTPVGEAGARLSGGQKQRVGIARALYSLPSMLILDEATSEIDSLTEERILKNIQNIAVVESIVMVAHRVNTLRNCDRIYLVQDGQIVGRGLYSELVQSSELFASLTAEPGDTTEG